jgi:predicted transcriptional regulator
MERFYDLLFEISNDNRHRILVLLKEKPLRITEISRQMNLTTQEISRNVSRLMEIGLLSKDGEGFYHQTPYSELTSIVLEELQFISKNRDYFIKHTVKSLQPEFVKRIGELSKSACTTSVMEFLYFVDKTIRESQKCVWLQVDQYPLTALGSIADALKRGVGFRIIENKNMSSGPFLNLESIEDTPLIVRSRNTPLSEQRTMDSTDLFLLISEDKCAVAFQISEGGFDYHGFTAADVRSLKWCRDLFQQNWEKSEPRIQTPTIIQATGIALKRKEGTVVIDGHNTQSDTQAIQDAVNNFKEVILRGTFDLGTSSIKISNSVKIRGEGKENGFPSTKLYKKGWKFPSTEFDSVFEIDGENSDVVIENLRFVDFDCVCIYGYSGKSLKLRDNAITISNGYGRGWKYGKFGDILSGVWLDSPKDSYPNHRNFPGGVSIEDNYIDFAYISKDSPELVEPIGIEDAEYPPDLINHEYYMGVGINILNSSCRILIENNKIHNMSSRGISVTDNFAEADVIIKHNTIESGIKGAYPFKELEAGVGIFAQSTFQHRRPGFKIDIEENEINLTQPNYSAITVSGPEIGGNDVGLLFGGSIKNNKISLKGGQAGIQIGAENFKIYGNKIVGEAYFGIQLSGMNKTSSNLYLAKDIQKDNDVSGLKVKDPSWRVRRHRSIEEHKIG